MDTNQITLEELKAWFEDVWNILVDIHISIKNMERLREDVYEFEEKIKLHGFFQHHWHQLKFISTIQLYKLTKNTEERSFEKLFNKLIKHKYSPDLKLHLRTLSETSTIICKDKNELALFCNQLKDSLTSKADLISKVHDLRNDVYAHKSSKKEVRNIFFDEFKELAEFLTTLFNEIWLRTFFKETHIFAEDWNINYVLYHCSESFKAAEIERIKRITRT